MLSNRRNNAAQQFTTSATIENDAEAAYSSSSDKTKRQSSNNKVLSGFALFLLVLMVAFFLRDSAVIPPASSLVSSSSSDITTAEMKKEEPSKLLVSAAAVAASSENPIQQWRNRYQQECSHSGVQWEKLQTFTSTTNDRNIFQVPEITSESTARAPSEDNVTPCTNVFLDLGSNVGDTIANVIGGGFPLCGAPPPDRNIKTMYRPMNTKVSLALKYNSTTGAIERNPIWNSLSVWLQDRWTGENAATIKPEDLCFFGFEGNPHFTKHLQSLAQHVMNTVPRPVQSAQFFTESVVTSVSGRSTLYLDAIGTDSNFDGSSTISSMTRIKQTKRRTHGVEKASVMGYTLTDILKMTVQPAAGGGHVYIKMDIEGAEFAVLNEAVEKLCGLVTKHKYKVAVVVEKHETDANLKDSQLYQSQTVDQLRACGVDLTHGDGG